MDLTTLVSGHLRYLGLGSPLIGESTSIELTSAGLALGQETAASPTRLSAFLGPLLAIIVPAGVAMQS